MVGNARLTDIEKKLHLLLSESSRSEAKDQEESALDQEITSAKSEIDKRDFPLAKSRLARLKRDKWDELTAEQRFLVLSNLGNIESARGYAAEASVLMFESIVHLSGDVRAEETEAHAHLLQGDYETAYSVATDVRLRHPNSWKSAMLRLYTAPPSVSFSELTALTEDDMSHKEILLAIAVRAHTLKLFPDGEDYARRAIAASDRDWPVARLILAQCIAHPILLGPGSRPIEGFSSEAKKRLEEADSILDECIKGALIREERQLAAQALVERAGIAGRIGNENSARIYVEQAYREAPSEPVAIAAYATLLQSRNEIDRAISMVETLISGTDHIAFKKQLSDLLLQRNRGDDEARAIDILKELAILDDPLSPHFRYALICETLALLARTSRIGEGEEFIDSIPGPSLTPAAQSAIMARLRLHHGDEAAAKSLLAKAEELLTDTSIETEIEMIAVTLATLGEYRRALALWQRILAVGNLLAMRQTLACAQRLGENAVILKVCRMIRESGIDDAHTLQIEADKLQDDDLNAAIDVLKDYLAKHPNNTEVRLRLTHIGIEHGIPELIQDNSFPLPDVSQVTPYVARAVTYYLKYVRRGEEALTYGYDVLHRHFNDLDAHRAFMVLFIPLGPPIRIDQPTVVSVGTAVEYVEDGVGSSTWHVIEDVVMPDLRLNEFAPSHSISSALIGKAVGDRVELTPNSISKRPAEIKQILNKYVYRMQRCSEELQIRFPEAKDLQVMHLPKGPDGQPSLDEFVATVQKQLEATNNALAHYSKEVLPLHFVATLLKASTFEAIFQLAHDPASIIRCAPDNFPQRQTSFQSLETSPQVVLDLSAIATLVLTGRTDLVSKLNKRIVISQGCSEELDRISGKLADGSSRAGGRLTWHDDRVIMVDIPEEAVIERERHFAKALTEIRAVAVVEPCRDLAEMSEEQRGPLISILGRHGAQSVLLARQPGRILWTDDFVQSSVAISEYGAKATWSECIISYLESKGLLERTMAVDFVTHLLGYRYESITITPAVFVNAARLANWDGEQAPLSFALAPLVTVPLSPQLFSMVGGMAGEIERELKDDEARARLIGVVLLNFLKRTDGIHLLLLIRRAFQNAPSQRGSEWTNIIDAILVQLFPDLLEDAEPGEK